MNDAAQIPYILTICSGKGGVGKSVLAANIANVIANMGLSVLIWDANSNFPNQHLLIGVEPPVRLNDVYNNNLEVSQAIFKISNKLYLLADMPAGGENKQVEADSFIDIYNQIIDTREYDVVIIDTPAGASLEVLQCARLADNVSIVITDEPTSLLDAYGLLKILLHYMDIDRINLLVNNVIDFEDAEDISRKLNLATQKFLQFKLDVFGFVPYDRIVRQSILLQELFTKSNPDSDVSKAISKIAENLLFKIQMPVLR